jgi:hypothetical protein
MMSKCSVQQAAVTFQPVNVSMTLESEKELTDFRAVINAGIGSIGASSICTELAETLSQQLYTISHTLPEK